MTFAGWLPTASTPAIVRRQMDDWDFSDARRSIRLARDIAERLVALPADTAGLADSGPDTNEASSSSERWTPSAVP